MGRLPIGVALSGCGALTPIYDDFGLNLVQQQPLSLAGSTWINKHYKGLPGTAIPRSRWKAAGNDPPLVECYSPPGSGQPECTPASVKLSGAPRKSNASPIACFRRPRGLTIEPAADSDQRVIRTPTVGAMLLS
jgi:hypothetical protein